jgi:uncharacterized protein involved in response to NO
VSDTRDVALVGLHPLQAVAARPFFLLAALLACLWIPLSLVFYFGKVSAPGAWGPIGWHSHEMIYGYAVAVIAGFLLTSARVWTGRETVYGTKLVAVVALWLLGRAAILGDAPWQLAGALDVAFLPVVAFAILVPIVASANWRNLGFPVLLLALALVNALWHLAPHVPALTATTPVLMQLSLDAVVLVVLTIGGRIIPAFTANAVGRELVRSPAWFDTGAFVIVAVSMVLAAVFPGQWPVAAIALLGGALTVLRMYGWGVSQTLSRPILWVLHLGWACVGLGLTARGMAWLAPSILAPSIATHLLTIGGVGVLTLGMMGRVSLGHTGRVLVLPVSALAAIVLLTIAILARVVVPLLLPSWHVPGLLIAAAAWSAAFTLYLYGYFTILISPRVDGRPG